jgi:CRP-like cAMP-binding protein
MNEKIKKQLVAFFNKYKLIKYKKGQLIFKPGEKISGVLFDKSGYVRVYTISKEGKEITLPMVKPLFFCSLIDVLLGKENKYYIEAISPVELWVAPENEFMDFLKSDPELNDKITKLMFNDFIDLTNNVQQLVFGDAYTKIASLIYSMSEKFGETKGKETIIGFNTP